MSCINACRRRTARRKSSLPRRATACAVPLVPPVGNALAEGLCGGGDDLILRYVAHVLSDVPAMPERILQLALQVAPKHVRQRLPNQCTRLRRLREYRFGIGDVKGPHHGRAAN